MNYPNRSEVRESVKACTLWTLTSHIGRRSVSEISISIPNSIAEESPQRRLDIILELTLAGLALHLLAVGGRWRHIIYRTEIKLSSGMTCHLNVIVMDHVTREETWGCWKMLSQQELLVWIVFIKIKVNFEKSHVGSRMDRLSKKVKLFNCIGMI